MSICYFPRPQSESIKNRVLNKKQLQLCRFNNVLNLKYDLTYSIMNLIIRYILINFCGVSVLSFDKSTGKYYCKKYNKSICLLSLEIELVEHMDGSSELKIVPLLTNNLNIKKFVYDFNEAIVLYKTSNFIKSWLEGGLL